MLQNSPSGSSEYGVICGKYHKGMESCGDKMALTCFYSISGKTFEDKTGNVYQILS